MRKSRILIILFCLLAIALACTVSGPTPYPSELHPPDTFGPENLVGTWQASYGTASVDTLTIKADDTYQQVFTKSGGESGDYYWESGWNKWWMEEDPSGCVYVHFEGMRYYGDSDDGTLAMTFYDTCNDKSFRMHNSVTLRVEINVTYRIEDMYPNIVLAHLELDPDSLTDMFRPISTPVPGP